MLEIESRHLTWVGPMIDQNSKKILEMKNEQKLHGFSYT